MTKVIILGQEPKEEKKIKPIEFVHIIDDFNLEFRKPTRTPIIWKNIELIQRGDKFDIMFAYDEDRNSGVLYLGHFNDGVVE